MENIKGYFEKEDLEKRITNAKKGANEFVENIAEEILNDYNKHFGEGFCIAEFYFPFGTVQLGYMGGDMFSLVDECDAYYKKPHGYPKSIQDFVDTEGVFNAEAFYTEIIRELGWIYELHKSVESQDSDEE